MRIRSATSIAVAALEHLKAYGKKNGFGPGFYREARSLVELRPTAVVLGNAVDALGRKASAKEIDNIISRLRYAKEKIAVKGAAKFYRKTVMTHCESTEAEALLIRARPRLVYATETRPVFQGVSTAKRLAAAGLKVALITDNACGFYLHECSAVVVGSDAMRPEGLVNKVGTLPLAIAAKEMGVPFYVAGNSFKIDRRKKIEIEMRQPSEVSPPIRGVKILNPVFDITPWKYVRAIITEQGIFKPARLAAMARRRK